jgi:hypothetical protein
MKWTPAFFFRGLVFKYRPRNRLYWLSFLVVLLSASKTNVGLLPPIMSRQFRPHFIFLFSIHFTVLCYKLPVAVAQWSKEWTVLAHLDAGIVGSNPPRDVDVYVYVYVYSVFVLSCVGRGLAMSWSLIQGVLPTVLDKETEVKRKVSWMLHAPGGVKKSN